MDLPISVVVPAYNGERWIAAALQSVRGQTRPPAEIVVVDDGSQDGTGSIARELGAAVVRQENAGVGPARNAGTQAARCPWIAFLDADDVWLPDKLARQWDALQAAPGAQWAITDYYEFEGDDVVLWKSVMHDIHPHAQAARRTAVAEDTYLYDAAAFACAQAFSPFILPSSTLARKTLLEETRGFRALAVYEDVDWFLRALKLSAVVYVDRPLVAYRRHPHSAMKNYRRLVDRYFAHLELMLAEPELHVAEAVQLARRMQPQRLREQAKLYARLGDAAGMDRTLRRLASVAPDARTRALSVAAGMLVRPPLRQAFDASYGLVRRLSRA